MIYTAIFSSENTSHGETHLEPEFDSSPEDGGSQQEQDAEPVSESGGSTVGKIVILSIAAIAALAAIGYGGWRGYQYIQKKKRGYV